MLGSLLQLNNNSTMEKPQSSHLGKAQLQVIKNKRASHPVNLLKRSAKTCLIKIQRRRLTFELLLN